MAQITFRTVVGETVTLNDPDAVRAELSKYDEAIDVLIPCLESDDDAEAAEAETLYDFLYTGIEAIRAALPAFEAELVREGRRNLAAQLRSRKHPTG